MRHHRLMNTFSLIDIRTIAIDKTIDIYEALSHSPSVLMSRRLLIPPLAGDTFATTLIENVSVSENTLVASVAKIVPGHALTSQILIADTDSGPAKWMQTRPLEVRDSLASVLMFYH